MGTRNLTMVILNGKPKVAQYGQWDGYPEGQGATILKFLHSLNDDYAPFIKKLKKVKWMRKKQNDELQAYLESIGCKDGWMTMEQSELYKKQYPLLSRDNGGGVLQMIMDTPDDRCYVRDDRNFVYDSLYCEWAYVIDLDKNTFEVYNGFNKSPLVEGDRFYTTKKPRACGDDTKYYAVSHFLTFDLTKLPTEKQFLTECENKQEELNALEQQEEEM